MKLAGFTSIALLIAAMTAGAQAAEESDFLLDLEKAHALSDGDLSQMPYFEECAESHFECGMIAGTVLRERKRIPEAEAFYRKALAAGYKPAATSIANMHTQAKNHLEGFAWSQLAYALDDPQQELSKDEMHRLASFRLLATNYQSMDEQQRAAAEKRAQEVVNELIPDLHDKILQSEANRDEAPIEIVKQVHPRYPRTMVFNRVHGFVLLYGEVDTAGRLVDSIAMDYSDRRFEKESLKAFKKWSFEVTDPNREKPIAVTQRVDFFIKD
jgi:hypothetical protein